MKNLVLSIGSRVRGDDYVGIEVARRIKSKLSELAEQEIDVKEARTTTLDLLSTIPSYDKVIIIDAVETETGKAGGVYKLNAKELKEPTHCSVHNSNLSSTLKLGEKLGLKIPEVIIYGIKIKDTSFKEGLSKELERAIPRAASKIMRELLKE